MNNDIVAGAGFIFQMHGNCHFGEEVIENDPNVQNSNGKLLELFLKRNKDVHLVNSLALCKGVITRKNNYKYSK